MSDLIDNIIKKTFDNFKKPTPALIAVSILTGMILFFPDSILDKMSLVNLPDTSKRIIGLVFLLSVALIAIIIVSSMFFLLVRREGVKDLKKTNEKNY